ncbi:hypothetical protein D3C72_697370 [compost metagenome]
MAFNILQHHTGLQLYVRGELDNTLRNILHRRDHGIVFLIGFREFIVEIFYLCFQVRTALGVFFYFEAHTTHNEQGSVAIRQLDVLDDLGYGTD